MLNVASIREKQAAAPHLGLPACERPTFRFAEVRGTPADHASWWSFDDEQELRDRYWRPRPGETVLDIGAAFGSYALPALALGARVVCFSPADFDTELLQHNLGLNPELQARCLVSRDGLYSRDGWFDPDKCKFTVLPPQGDYVEQWLKVRALDSFLAERPGIARVDWMKLDVEGAELEVLVGAEETIRAHRPRILVELHEFHDKDMARKVIDYLDGLGVGYCYDGPHKHCAVSHAFFWAE